MNIKYYLLFLIMVLYNVESIYFCIFFYLNSTDDGCIHVPIENQRIVQPYNALGEMGNTMNKHASNEIHDKSNNIYIYIIKIYILLYNLYIIYIIKIFKIFVLILFIISFYNI